LEAGSLEGDIGGAGPGLVVGGACPTDSDRQDRPEAALGEDLAVADQGGHRRVEAPGNEGACPGLVRVRPKDDAALMEDEDLLQQTRRLVDEMGRHDDGPWMLAVGEEQLVVKDPTRRRVQP